MSIFLGCSGTIVRKTDEVNLMTTIFTSTTTITTMMAIQAMIPAAVTIKS